MTLQVHEAAASAYRVVGAGDATVTGYNPLRFRVSIDIELFPANTAGLGSPNITRANEALAREPRTTRSLREVLGTLGRAGLEAFDKQSALNDSRLRERYESGEISALYFYRCLARMTQEQLAERAKTGQPFLSQLEKRKRTLTWKQATKLARALGVEAEKLMER